MSCVFCALFKDSFFTEQLQVIASIDLLIFLAHYWSGGKKCFFVCWLQYTCSLLQIKIQRPLLFPLLNSSSPTVPYLNSIVMTRLSLKSTLFLKPQIFKKQTLDDRLLSLDFSWFLWIKKWGTVFFVLFCFVFVFSFLLSSSSLILIYKLFDIFVFQTFLTWWVIGGIQCVLL